MEYLLAYARQIAEVRGAIEVLAVELFSEKASGRLVRILCDAAVNLRPRPQRQLAVN